MADSSIRRIAISVVAAATISGCSDISDQQSKMLSKSGAVLVDVKSTKTAFHFPELPARPTVGQGAAYGAAEGALYTAGEAIFNPFAILLLPIMIPAGAAIGAASVPNDEEWKAVTTEYQRLKEVQTRVFSDRKRRKTSSEIEAGILSAFKEKSDSCIAPSRRAAKCRGAQQVSTISVVIRPIIDGEGYTLQTAVEVNAPGMSKPTCIKKDYKRLYSKEAAVGRVGPERVLSEIEEMHSAFGKLLAFELYDAPIIKMDKGFGEARVAAQKGVGWPVEGKLQCRPPA